MMSRFTVRKILVIAGYLWFYSSGLSAEEKQTGSWNVLRSTSNQWFDTVQGLVNQQRYDEAIDLCNHQSQQQTEQSLSAAKWAVEHSEVLVAQAREQAIFDQSSISDVVSPVEKLLASYPDHRFRFFLRAQIQRAQKQAVLHLVARAAISPLNKALQQNAVRYSVVVSNELTGLVQEISDYRSKNNGRDGQLTAALRNDHLRLQRSLRVDLVSLALLQTDLLNQNTDDFISAASRAEKMATEFINTLPSGTEARLEVQRLRLEALLRMRQYGQVASELNELRSSATITTSEKWTALRARLRIKQDNELAARDELVSYYQQPLEALIGSQQSDINNAIEIDLALLQFFLAYGTSRRVTDCLNWIEKRGGRYARLRADAITLDDLLRKKESDGSQPNPQLLVVRGQQIIRNGNLQEGAELLALASELPGPADSALQYAVEAAAIFSEIKALPRAIDTLQRASVTHSDGGQSSIIHLQSLLMFSKLKSATSQELKVRLDEHLKRWPESNTAPQVREWLYGILSREGRHLQAALLLTRISNGVMVVTDEGLLSNAWHQVLINRSSSWEVVSEAFLESAKAIEIVEDMPDELCKLKLILLEPKTLSSQLINHSLSDFERAIYGLRVDGISARDLLTPSEDWCRHHWLEDLSQSLINDAEHTKTLRKQVADLLMGWQQLRLSELDQARCMIWLGKVGKAIQFIDQWIKDEPDSNQRLKASANLLQSCDSPVAISRAADYWGRIATGLPQGDERWHAAKLSRIKALRSAGNEVEAKKLANYLLLTAPGLTDFWRAKYGEQVK